MPEHLSTPQSPEDRELRVDVARQIVDFLQDGQTVKSWPVSTSRFGLGCSPGSFKTPTGRFFIDEKIGAGAPLGMEFKSRQPTGLIVEPGGGEDSVLTRILWLAGEEPENKNTKDRYIYFHGTNQEDLIGTPASHGCVRLRNADIAELFELVPTGTRVVIA
jgi:lipoprotein-anchoring transpeptidase ErfK/SrfK